ncbi:hypothetical protein BEWA_032490 [Theileria equi strain WA]|uniref:Signal recognition particle subunit SRP72 n=1 Tax=Theileria equi strain WA TaxID=1537102 RepID=L0AZI3_THEEQ|nr:hypothetical protein BEWA_032490 [Theileria equi strain WA]AFZ80396.1 hypothetical protein BEWA_032490 [Theileria equi strain WA]|eukprot:XP_004830062.1 hypothetical protein BEWA_032490 [Theileria equi strain WA]
MGDSIELTSLESSLKQLNVLLDEARFAEACKLCHKCLKQWPGENVLYRVKIYCEMQLSRWHSCLQTIGWLHGFRSHPAVSDKKSKRSSTQDDANTELSENIKRAASTHLNGDNCLWFHFEQSYCYYKLGKYDLGLQVLSMCSEGLPPRDLLKTVQNTQDTCKIDDKPLLDSKVTLLKAQLLLRLGHFEQARSIYNNVKIKGSQSLVSINRLSVDIALASETSGEDKEAVINDLHKSIEKYFSKPKSDDPYELYYNYACAYALSGDILKAQDYLDLADETLVNELKGENLDVDGQDQAEFANILAFRAFLHGKRGNLELGKSINTDLFNTMSTSLDVDQSTFLVVLCNQLLFGDENVDILVPKIESLLKKEQIVRKFSTEDLKSIHENCICAMLARGNVKDSQRYLNNFKHQLKDVDLILLKAALLSAEGKTSKSMSLLRQGLSQGSKSFKLASCLIRLLLKEGKYKEALSVSQDYYDLFTVTNEALKAYFLLVIKVHISLGSTEGVHSSLLKLLNVASPSGDSDVIKAGCSYLESQNKHLEAMEIYSELYKRDNNDKMALCGILYNESFTDVDQGIKLSKDFIDGITRDIRFIDPEELEATTKVTFQTEEHKEGEKLKRRKRKRPGKKPKNMDLPVDPERWLHKYERVSFKKSARRRKDATKGQTQGSTSASSSKPTTGSISATTNAAKRGKRKKR